MELGTLFVIVLLLACPLLMVFMHRGGHGTHAGHGHADDAKAARAPSLAELHTRRDELAAEIARLEQAEPETKPPSAA